MCLLKKKWIRGEEHFRRRTGDRMEQVAVLASSGEEALEYARQRPRSAAMQKAVLELLCDLGTVSVKELCYFTGAKPATVRRLRDLGYVELRDREVLRCREIKPAAVSTELILNEEQTVAYEGLLSQMRQDAPGTALLYGVTGSGKTFTMANIIEKTQRPTLILAHNKTLAAQLYSEFRDFFPENEVHYFVSYFDYITTHSKIKTSWDVKPVQ